MAAINMPQLPQTTSGIDGILKGLQAVHDFYGIDTQKDQAKLIALQKEHAEQLANEEKTYANGGPIGRLMAFEKGLMVSPSQTQVDNGQGNVSNQTNPTLTPISPVTSTEWDLKKQELHNAQQTGKKLELENKALPSKIQTEQNAPTAAAQDKFNEIAKPEMENLDMERQAVSDIKNGKPMSNKAAATLVLKMQGAISRISQESGQDYTEAIGKSNQFMESIKKNTGGNLTIPQQQELADQLSNIGSVVRQAYLDKANAIARAHWQGTNLSEGALGKMLQQTKPYALQPVPTLNVEQLAAQRILQRRRSKSNQN